MIGQSSNLPGHQGNPGHWPFGSYTNIHAKTAANWVEHAQLLWCFSIHSQVRKSTVEPLSTISQDASRCSGLLRASYLEHVVRTELINITFPLIQGSAHTHTRMCIYIYTYRYIYIYIIKTPNLNLNEKLMFVGWFKMVSRVNSPAVSTSITLADRRYAPSAHRCHKDRIPEGVQRHILVIWWSQPGPFGKRLHNYGKIHHAIHGKTMENSLFRLGHVQ